MSGFNSGVVNMVETPGIIQNTLANRPAAGLKGRLFISTDVSNQVFQRDNGAAWVDILPGTAGVPATRQLTIGGVTQDLSANRTWNAIMQGGNTYGAAMSFGSNDSQEVNLRTNNDNKLKVYTDGTVGIQNGGTFTKTAGDKLFVTGGRFRLTGTTQEDLLNLSNDQAGQKLLVGIGRGNLAPAGGGSFLAMSTSGVTTDGMWMQTLYQFANRLQLFFRNVDQFIITHQATNEYPTLIGGAKSFSSGSTNIPLLGIGSPIGQADHAPTAGNLVWLQFPKYHNNNWRWAPASGSANQIFIQCDVTSALPVGSTADGYLNFVTWSPVVASGATPNYRFIISNSTSGYDLYLTGGAKSRITGNVGIGADAHATHKLFITGSIAGTTTVTTGQPSANGAGAWKLGKFLAGAVTLNTSNYIEVEIDGVVRKLLIAN